MEYREIDGPDGTLIRVPVNADYRICAHCGGNCEPDPAFGADGLGARIAFVCAEHGINTIIDPFEHLR